jgi:hypothetical protein
VVYELESGPSSRNQGGTLDLHEDSGQLTLRQAGLLEEFKEKARPEGEALKIASPTGGILWNENGKEAGEISGRPEIDRVALRDLLLSSIEPDRIRWGKKLRHVEPSENDTVRRMVRIN